MADVVLVDEMDREIGVREKLEAHRDGALHRAISVFLFDAACQRMLLQQRAFDKYHSGGLWSNTCCSHPAPGELPLHAAQRRLLEELAIECPLEFAFTFIYRANVGRALVEHELDHVFIGRCDATARPDPAEIADLVWMKVGDVRRDVVENPARFSPWFPLALAELERRGLPGPTTSR